MRPSLIAKIGVKAISERLKSLRNRLVAGLREKGYDVTGVPSPDILTGITSFRHEKRDMASLYRHLDEKGIIVSLRDDLSGNRCIRVSPHFYNSETEIDMLLENV